MGSSNGESRSVETSSSGRDSLCALADRLNMMSCSVGHDDRGCIVNENFQEIS